MRTRTTIRKFLVLPLSLIALVLLLVGCAAPSEPPAADVGISPADRLPAPANGDAAPLGEEPAPAPEAQPADLPANQPADQPANQPADQPPASPQNDPSEGAAVLSVPSSPKLIYDCYDSANRRLVSTRDAAVFAADHLPGVAIEVTIGLSYPPAPACNCYDLPGDATDEEVDAARQAHHDHLKAYHTEHNQAFLRDSGLSSASASYELSLSSLSHQIRLEFRDYDAFAQTLPRIAALADDPLVSSIRVCQPQYVSLEQSPTPTR